MGVGRRWLVRKVLGTQRWPAAVHAGQRDIRLWAPTGAIAAAIGPSVGGLLTQFGWQWVFLINLPVGAALLVVSLREVHDVRSDDEAGSCPLCGRPG